MPASQGVSRFNPCRSRNEPLMGVTLVVALVSAFIMQVSVAVIFANTRLLYEKPASTPSTVSEHCAVVQLLAGKVLQVSVAPALGPQHSSQSWNSPASGAAFGHSQVIEVRSPTCASNGVTLGGGAQVLSFTLSGLNKMEQPPAPTS